MTKIVAAVAALCLAASAETLGDVLRSNEIPSRQFTAGELAAKIDNHYVASAENPFLLAYHLSDQALHLIRYDRGSRTLNRASQPKISDVCLGTLLDIREHRGVIYVDTHINPSAGCVLVFNSTLEFRKEIYGWVVGLLGGDYAILRASEIHFMAVHPMHIELYDVKRNRVAEVFPFAGDAERAAFSRLLKSNLSEAWCREHNAPCDENLFEADLEGEVAVNEAARAFGFTASYSAAGFGEAAEKKVQPRKVVYLFREKGGAWSHEVYPEPEFRFRFGGKSVAEVIGKSSR